jgi:hypothetical protein
VRSEINEYPGSVKYWNNGDKQKGYDEALNTLRLMALSSFVGQDQILSGRK